MIWLVVSLLMVAVGTWVRIFHTRRVDTAIAAQRRHLIDDLERETGMTVEGDVLEAFTIRGALQGIEFSLENNAATKVPGPSSEQRSCALVELGAAIPDMVVCSLGDVDAVMGPIPSVPRTLTGDTTFDAAYAIFTATPTGEAPGGFRTTQAADALAWAKPDVLRQCIALGMLWFRVRGARGQLAAPPTNCKRAHQILTLAVNIALAAAGRPIVEMPVGLPTERRVQGVAPFWGVAIVAIAGGMLVSVPTVMLLLLDRGWETALAMFVCSAALYFGWIIFSFLKWTRQTGRKEQ